MLQPQAYLAKKENDRLNQQPSGNKIINFIYFILWLAAVSLPISVLFIAIHSLKQPHTILTIVLIILHVLLTIALIYGVTKYYQYKGYQPTNTKFKFKPKDILYNLSIFFILRVTVAGLSLLMLHMTNETISSNDQEIKNQFTSIIDFTNPIKITLLVCLIISITIVAPYVEEHVFRGIFRETLFIKRLTIAPLILSSLIFATGHSSQNIIAYLIYLLLGIGLYVAYNRRNNLWDSIFVHFLNNVIATIGMIYVLV